ncbi:MAG: cupin domain-containing protein [Actinobacteria bacterium]|nr:cupin domain-containing protein [Actinomycetota bacterium]
MIKLSRAEDAPTLKGPGDGRTKVLIDSQVGAKNLSLCWIKFPVGGKSDLHTRDVEECIYVIKGRTVVVSGHERVEFGEGDAVFIQAGVEHYHENIGSSELEQIVVFSPQGPESILRDLPLE